MALICNSPEKYRNKRFCMKLLVNNVKDLEFVPMNLLIEIYLKLSLKINH